ncbi:hepcidin-1 isoform X1 [Stegastes partitus]|uniref:Hepcidin-like n=1 Tax=Stegastes partitus TaxID=144197 RepID=A0A3B5AH66_9TELE|nr:PREDICTED: hepcidin-like isoform X1 [Stegastes partitus]
MKTFSVAVAVAVMLTFICIQESSAVPLSEDQELEVSLFPEHPAAANGESAVDSWEKSGIHCRICCGCCTPGVCGLCCKWK